MSKPETIKIDEVEYVRKDSVKMNERAEPLGVLPYCIVRTYSAGVFAGYLDKTAGNKYGTILDARRIWKWAGAASLSQLAVDGTSKPGECKFPCEVDKIDVTEIIEVLYCTQKAKDSIQGVKVWKE